MARYSLGSLDFMFFHGTNGPQEAPQILETVKTIHARPGVDGVSVKSQGKKGRAFPMVSFKDEESLQGCLDTYILYKEAEANQEALDIVWENGNWSGLHQTSYVPIHVGPPRARYVSSIVAPAVKTTTSPDWILEVIWTLIPVDFNQVP